MPQSTVPMRASIRRRTATVVKRPQEGPALRVETGRMPPLAKAPTGIAGLDAVTDGGLPAGRCTLVCGGPGSGKTLLATQFLVHGARALGEPGLFVSFEETEAELRQNGASLGYDLARLQAAGTLAIDHVTARVAPEQEAGDFDLEGLLVRLAYAVDRVGAKRIAIDSLEALLSGIPNRTIVRSEVRRLFAWVKQRGLTAVVTAERGLGTLTREGFEEYVSDCVILMEQRVEADVATRRIRILKYRGSAHATNDMPFLIDADGFSVVPITESRLDTLASTERVSTGIAGLDVVLGGPGVYRGTSVLVSGEAGTGKTTVASHFVDAACRRGERALYVSFEESPGTLVRDMRSVGMDLLPWVEAGTLRFEAVRAVARGLEGHHASLSRILALFRPAVVVLDPVSGFTGQGDARQAKNMLLMLGDSVRDSGATLLMTALISGGATADATEVGISSAVDVWLSLRNVEANGERNRVLQVLKARGIAHSNQVREFHLTNSGVLIAPPYIGEAGVLTGSARRVQEEKDTASSAAADELIRDLGLERSGKASAFAAALEGLQREHRQELADIDRKVAAAAGRRADRQGQSSSRRTRRGG